MPTYSESGLIINLPHQDYFRISDCNAWDKKLKSVSLSEMDFGWWDANTNELYFLEVKDFTQLAHPKAKKSKSPRSFIDKFVSKATDMLTLLAGIWLKTTEGENMTSNLLVNCPNFPLHFSKVKLFFVVKTNDPNIGIVLDAMNIEIRTQLQGRMMLLNLDPVNDISLLDHESAIRRGLPIQ